MTAPEFRVGDRVEALEDYAPGDGLTKGSVYTVTEVSDFVYVTKDDGSRGGYIPSRFRKAEPDIEKLRQDVIEAALKWRATPDYCNPAADAVLDAVDRLQAAVKPEPIYRIYYAGDPADKDDEAALVEYDEGRFRTYVKRWESSDYARNHVHPINPETGLAGAELSPEQLKALLEREQ